MNITFYKNSIFSSVSYILKDCNSKSCWIIDVGDYEKINELTCGYCLKGVFLTHVHYDHIYGLNKLLDDNPIVPIYTNAFGAKSLLNPIDNLSTYYGCDFVVSKSENIKLVKEGDCVNLGNESLTILETPGHDYSCLSFLVQNNLFTGDAYIPGESVFVKLQNSNRKLANISFNRLLRLSDNNIVRAGHMQ